MCGLIGGTLPRETIEAALPTIAHRGPDSSGVWSDGHVSLGHTRLAIQNLGGSAQPYEYKTTTLTFNGEVWDPSTLPGQDADPLPGDTGPLARALHEEGPEVLRRVHGMFALAWVTDGVLHLARDTYGEVPLHYGRVRGGGIAWASEIGPLLSLGVNPRTIKWFPPGRLLTVQPDGEMSLTKWAASGRGIWRPGESDPEVHFPRLFDDAVRSRMRADVPVAVLLSGGLDSAATTGALVKQGYDLTAYVAVHDVKASDVQHARAIAKHYAIPLVEVPVPPPTARRVERAVRVAEMPHKAQIEITLACLELADALRGDGFRVVLSGEGSDELWASYGMAYHGIKQKGWNRYREDLFTGQHRKNFPRVNKVFMAAGVEARMPFLDPPLVRYALSLPQSVVTGDGRHPKALLARTAVEEYNLPTRSAFRTKQAFQTNAKLDQSAARLYAKPAQVYKQMFATEFRGVTA